MPRDAPVMSASRPANRPLPEAPEAMVGYADSASSESWAGSAPPVWSVSAVG
jgi:hypothetical protein